MKSVLLVIFVTLVDVLTSDVSREESHCMWQDAPPPCKYCEAGWYGDSCNRTCSNCDPLGCAKDTGRCFSCLSGYYSEVCNIPCPMNCKNRVCKKENGHCKNCKHGYWGKKCYTPCSKNCLDASCFSFDGSCVYGCRDGWRGRTCSERCPGGCSKCTSDGKCIQTCQIGFYGDSCDQRCNSNCEEDDCVFDYVFNETVCRNECIQGWMSHSCDKPCWRDCVSCYKVSGYCSTCRSGHWGPACSSECSMTCVDSICDVHGNCTHGCYHGFHGRSCDRTCEESCKECDQRTGLCLVCKLGWDKHGFRCIGEIDDTDELKDKDKDGGSFEQKTVIIGSLFVSLIVLVSLLVIIIVKCRNTDRRKEKTKTSIEHHTDE